MGITLVTISEKLLQEFGAKVDGFITGTGVIVWRVVVGSPADKYDTTVFTYVFKYGRMLKNVCLYKVDSQLSDSGYGVNNTYWLHKFSLQNTKQLIYNTFCL